MISFRFHVNYLNLFDFSYLIILNSFLHLKKFKKNTKEEWITRETLDSLGILRFTFLHDKNYLTIFLFLITNRRTLHNTLSPMRPYLHLNNTPSTQQPIAVDQTGRILGRTCVLPKNERIWRETKKWRGIERCVMVSSVELNRTW